MGYHVVFDLSAWLLAIISGILVYQWRLSELVTDTVSNVDGYYFLMISCGGIFGAYFFGTLNLYLSDFSGIGRSIIGGLLGSIICVELYKRQKGISRSTGIIFAVPIAVAISIGRLGCFLFGLDDRTYGVMTNLPIGFDFGDGITRHPVQLYESVSMFIFLVALLFLFWKRNRFALQNSFYLCIGWYALQRFLWEFIKPYGTILGSFNLFHIICGLLIIYSLFMIKKGNYVNA